MGDALIGVAPAGFTKIKIGKEVQLKAEVVDDKGNLVKDAKVFWKNDDHGVWTHEDGVISGAAMGPCTVVAEAEGKAGELAFEVVE